MSRLDPRDPLVLDARSLVHRPGQMSVVEKVVPAPVGLAVDVISVPEGSPIELWLRLESVVEGILVSGTAEVHASGECVRCLEPVELELTVDLQELFAYPGAAAAEDQDIVALEEELINLGPMLRDAVVLALPLQPVCDEECEGLCASCGVRLSDEPGHLHEVMDPRWAALQSVAAQTKNDDETRAI